MMLDQLFEADAIITLDPQRPRARRMGVIGGMIVGFDEDLKGMTARSTERFDGATIVPGFNDAHCHTTWWGLGLQAVPLDRARGLEELYSMLEAEVRRLDAQPDAWIHGTGFNDKDHDSQYPSIDRLDAITGNRPLYLRHTSGHSAITNTATLRAVGALEPAFTDPTGGAVVRDAAGRPTGVLEETAQSLLQRRLLPYAAEDIADALDAATRRYAARGITSFTEAGVGGGWIGHSPTEVAAYQLAAETGRLHARAQLMPALDSLSTVDGHAQDFHGMGTALGLGLGERFAFGTDRVRFGHVKVFLDGSLLGRTAAVTESFCGHHGNTGYLLDTPEQYRERVKAVYRAGWPIALHAIGDAAIDLALDLIEDCQDSFGLRGAPNRIEHFGVSRPDQVARAGRLGVAVTPQAGFLQPIGDQMADRLDDHRRDWIYRGRTLVEAGVILAGSSDLPVADNDMLRGMQSAIDRRSDTGAVIGAQEGLTAEQALRSYTEWSAAANGQSSTRGTLARAKFADAAVLSGSPLEADDLNDLDVLATFVGGSCTHRR